MRKRICLFFAAMLLCMSNIMAQVASGSCGDNITWKLSAEGELIIEGTGEMYNYLSDENQSPWYETRENISSVKIEEGVTSIGRDAFFDCRNLVSATIPASVTTIRPEAFRDSGIRNITFAENSQLKTLEEAAFNNCISLLSIYLPASVTSIRNGAFFNCRGLAITCMANTPPTVAGEYTFYNVDKSIPIHVPASSVEAYRAAYGWGQFTNILPVIASGPCGNNLTWRLTNDGELTIEGIGAMTSTPWSIYSEQVSTVTIGEGVTNIGEWAFGYYPNLTSITIPASVTTIGGAAFENCSSLASVTIAENSQLVSIGSSAFKNCSNLTSFTLPASVTSIENDAFWGTGLTSFVIPENSQLATIGDWAFNGSAGLTTISFPASLTSIGYYAFCDCSSLASVTIAENSQLVSIGSSAFKNCSNLTSFTLPASVTSIENDAFWGTGLTSFVIPENSQLATIGDWAFNGSAGLTTISFPASLTSIGDYAFCDCNFTSITCNAVTPPSINNSFPSTDASALVYVPAASVEVYKASEGWSKFTNIQPIIIGSGSCGDNLTWKLIDSGELIIEGTGTMYNYSNNPAAPWHSYRSLIKSVNIKDGVTSIGSWAFAQCSALTDVSIAESVTSIGGDAFRECRILEEVILPTGLTQLGTGVFLYCDALKSIIVPEGVTIIGSDTFEFCPNLNSITFPSGLTEIGPWALKGANNLASITCKATTPPSIGNGAFGGVNSSIPVYVPAASVEAYKAANGWSKFTNIQPIIIGSGSCGDNLTWKLIDSGELIIEGTGTMYNYSNNPAAPWHSYRSLIKSVNIKDGVTSIGSWAFAQCSALTDVSIAESVTSIGGDAFRECRILEEVILPTGLTQLGTGVFLYCDALKSIIVPEGVTIIGSDTFEFCPNLNSITFPSGLTEIGSWALKGANKLASITCKATTPPSIGNDTFGGVNSSIPVYVPAASVEAYKVANGWSKFTNIQPMVVSGTCGENLTWKFIAGGELIIEGTGEMTSAPWSVYKDFIDEITIREGVTSIVDGAFQNCSALTSVEIPNSVTSIGDNVFSGCSNLTSIKLRAATPPATGSGLFDMCDNLETIYVPFGAVEAYKVAPWNAYNIVELVEINNPVLVGDLYYNVDVENKTAEVTDGRMSSGAVVIPASISLYGTDYSVTSIGNRAFMGCFDLTSIEIPSSVTSIGDIAFADCRQLTSIEIPKSVTSIGEFVFEFCLELNSVTMQRTTPPVAGIHIFEMCDNLETIYVPLGAAEAYNVMPWNRFSIVEIAIVNHINLTDGEDYTNATEQEADRITYTREFKNTQWQAWYVPFDIDYDAISDEFTAASLNAVHQYDDDEDGVFERWTLEILKLKSGEVLRANMPYMIRAKETGEHNFVVENAILYPAEENSLDCSSVRVNYTFKGNYSLMDGQVLRDNGWFAPGGGSLVTPTVGSNLKAYRWLLMPEARSGYGTFYAPKRINIVIGDEEGEVTGIEAVTQEEWPADVYDLNGRMVKAQAENLDELPEGVYIVNGKKFVK